MILCLCPNPSVDMFVWISGIEPGQTNRVIAEEHFPGGKGVHVALAMAELGEEVALLGCWGGPSGSWIKSICESKGIACYGPQLAAWTRCCISFKSEGPLDETELLGKGPTISSEHMKLFTDTYDHLVVKADSICMSGSWPEGATADVYARLIEKAKQHHKRVFLDCSGTLLSHALKAHPFSVHLNRKEGAALYGEITTADMAHLLARECEYAAMTAGADGLYLATGRGSTLLHATCPVEQVYSAVGSGDCLMAGLAIAFTRGMSPAEATRLAVACGASNCMNSELGMLDSSDVEMLLTRTTLRKITIR